MTVQIATGLAPDIIEMWGANATDCGEHGFLYDLTAFVERDETEIDPADFFPGDYEAGIVQSGPYTGQRFGLPRYTNASVIFYNTDYFNEAGLVTPGVMAQQGEWTWDTLRDSAQKLTLRDADGDPIRYGYRTFFGDARFAPWIWASGGSFVEGPREVAFDSSPAIVGMRFLHDMIWQDQVATFEGGWEQGQIAMREQGSKDMGAYGNAIGDSFEWDIAPLPVGPAGTEGSWIAGDMWGMVRTTEHPEEAWAFLKFLTSIEGMEMMTRLTGLPGSRFSTLDSVVETYSGRSVMYHLQSASGAQALPFSTMPLAKEVSRIFDQTIRLSLEQNPFSIESALSTAADQVRSLYDAD